MTFTVTPPPTCANLNSAGTNQFVGCFWRWRSSTTPTSPEDGILAGEATPAQPGYLAPVPSNASAIDINWGSSLPANSLTGTDHYSARWIGNFTFDPGTYHFTGGSDDGMRVFTDGSLRIDQWILRAYTENSFDLTFPVRTTVNMRIDFMEGQGGAQVKFGWTKLN
jgi:hypothetical protein